MKWLKRLPAPVWLTLAAILLGPWLVGACLAYVILVMHLFGVDLAPAR